MEVLGLFGSLNGLSMLIPGLRLVGSFCVDAHFTDDGSKSTSASLPNWSFGICSWGIRESVKNTTAPSQGQCTGNILIMPGFSFIIGGSNLDYIGSFHAYENSVCVYRKGSVCGLVFKH